MSGAVGVAAGQTDLGCAAMQRPFDVLVARVANRIDELTIASAALSYNPVSVGLLTLSRRRSGRRLTIFDRSCR